ncbi:MAG TPA: pyruvate dehydrogenase (acetyl-transferring) E1 component subunit alpha [Longimicrobium sp.]|jgi:pyruvate dehydrogenase E1 component alpha subunit|uniref:pyruvate dehydrogenase (acetyl-transferring) E1 component subunit alpha n=1 Tax=Longimicrobium sp. TaxID=2029185 RepID=UPI002ED907AB
MLKKRTHEAAPAEDTAAATESVAHAEDQAPEAAVQEAAPDREAMTAEKPALSDEERLQGLEPEKLRKMMYDMLLARRFEEKVAEAYALGKIGGFCHLYIGQEAVAVGAIHAQTPDDYVMTAYREHVHALQCGVTPGAVMAELYGRADGCSKGKGGSMHMFDAEKNYLGGHGIVGGQIPLALGVAWKIKYRQEERVIQVYCGEAAVNQGAFHESLNMAALWKVPMILIVENNRFGMGTAWERASSLYDIYQKATAYAMPSAVADGMDVLDMYRVTKEAVDRARAGGGPTLIEARTYRFVGHSMSDPVSGVYRTKEDVEKEKGNDPIRIFADLLARQNILSQEELEQMDEEVKRVSEESADFAEKSPEPAVDELYTEIYATEDVNGRLYFDGRR